MTSKVQGKMIRLTVFILALDIIITLFLVMEHLERKLVN